MITRDKFINNLCAHNPMTNIFNTILSDLGAIFDETQKEASLLGEGGMGTVELFTDKRNPKDTPPHAIKRSPSIYTEDHDEQIAVNCMLNEISVLKKLSHPQLPVLTGYYLLDAHIHRTTECIPGDSLQDLLDAHPDDPWTSNELKFAAKSIATTLAYVHSKGILHNDIKPANIILSSDLEKYSLIDFGLAREKQELEKLCSLATWIYAPPEKYKGSCDERSDIYSLGLTLKVLTSGENPPFKNTEWKQTRELNPKVNKQVARIIDTCCATNPEDRYPNCQALLVDLEKVDLYSITRRAKLIGLIEPYAPGLARLGEQICRNMMD